MFMIVVHMAKRFPFVASLFHKIFLSDFCPPPPFIHCHLSFPFIYYIFSFWHILVTCLALIMFILSQQSLTSVWAKDHLWLKRGGSSRVASFQHGQQGCVLPHILLPLQGSHRLLLLEERENRDITTCHQQLSLSFSSLSLSSKEAEHRNFLSHLEAVFPFFSLLR